MTIWLEFLWKHFAKGSTAWDEQLSVQQLFLTPTSNNPKVQCKAEIQFFTFLFVEKKTCGGLARASFSLFALSLEIASATNLSCSNHTFTFYFIQKTFTFSFIQNTFTFYFIQNTFTFCVPNTFSFAVLPLTFNFLLIRNTFPFTQSPNYHCNPHMNQYLKISLFDFQINKAMLFKHIFTLTWGLVIPMMQLDTFNCVFHLSCHFWIGMTLFSKCECQMI